MDESEDSEGSEVMTGRIKEITARPVSGEDKTEVVDEIGVKVVLTSLTGRGGDSISFLADNGVKKTFLNRKDWESLGAVGELQETGWRFRPYGTRKQLPIRGKARVRMTAGARADIPMKV